MDQCPQLPGRSIRLKVWPIFWIAPIFLFVIGGTALGQPSRSCLDGDLPDFETNPDYRAMLTAGTLAPDRVAIGRSIAITGMCETTIESRFGADFRITEDSADCSRLAFSSTTGRSGELRRA